MAKQRFQPKLHIKTGDTVKVIAGEDKGATGKVVRVIPEDLRAEVEGVNVVKRHVKPTAQQPGGIVEKNATIHISNLMLVDAQGTASRIGRRVENGKTVRYSKKTNQTVK